MLCKEVGEVVHLEIVKVTAEIKALPGSISHCPVSVDPAQQCSRVINRDISKTIYLAISELLKSQQFIKKKNCANITIDYILSRVFNNLQL